MGVRDERGKPPIVLPRKITVTVGVHGDAGAVTHGPANDTRPGAANDTGAVEKRPLTVADIATFNEFGTATIPQRSFIRAWFDENQAFIAETLRSQMKLVIAGKLTPEKAGARIALACEGSMKQRISRGIPPPNAPSTIERKGSSKPLIDTGQLRNAIRGRAVVDEAGAELGTETAAE
ncbi:MAG TPA: hypothetical protein VIU86_19970 [Gaiellaceae bacterium]